MEWRFFYLFKNQVIEIMACHYAANNGAIADLLQLAVTKTQPQCLMIPKFSTEYRAVLG